MLFCMLLLVTSLAPESAAQVTTYPYNEGFESGTTYGPWGSWTQGPRSSNPRWQRLSGQTSSSNTGPSGAQAGSYYAYLETSGGSLGDTDYITCTFNFASLTSPEISFYYHMYGATMGTLGVEVSTNGGGAWTSLWSITGQQHSSMTAAWTAKTISLCQYAGLTSVMLRFVGMRGSDYYSDMAIDNLFVGNSTAGAVTYGSSTTTQNETSPVSAGFTNQEILGVEIVNTGSCPLISVSSFSFSTTGSSSASDITNAKLWYTGENATFGTTTQVGATVSNPSGSFSFSPVLSIGPGTHYFWLTYDISASASNGNVVDAQCSGITVGGVLRTPTVTNPTGSRSIIVPLSGSYTINPTGAGARNYTSFSAAVTALSAAGITGPVTFDVAAGTYNEQVTIPPILGASAVNTITFDGGTGNASTRTLTYATPNQYDYVVRLNGADYIVLKNLSIVSTGATYGYGIHLTNQADHNEISNCNVTVSTTSTNTYCMGIFAGAETSNSSDGDWANYTLVKNNVVRGGYYCVRFNGISNSGSQCVGNRFHGNQVLDFYYYGMYLDNQSQLEVLRNTVVQRNPAGTTAGYGLYIYYPQNGARVEYNNVIVNAQPIRFYYANYYGTPSPRAKVINNMAVARESGTTNYGLYIYNCKETDIWFNSVRVAGNSSYAFYLYGSTTQTGFNLDVRNNMIEHAGNSTARLIYNNNSSIFSTFDYNQYYTTSTAADMFYYDATYYATWAALPRTVHNVNSKFGNPYFMSETDLHSRSIVGYQAGVAIATVLDDIDGQARGLNPCFGADEYPTPPAEIDVAVTGVSFDYATGQWARLEGAAMHPVRAVVENVGLEKAPATVTLVYKLGSVPANSSDGVAEVFSPAWANEKAVLRFSQEITGLTPAPSQPLYVRLFMATDQNSANDAAMDQVVVDDVKKYGRENFQGMVAPFFSKDPGSLDYGWSVMDLDGGNTWETATFGPATELVHWGSATGCNDWVFTPAATLDAGSSYRLRAVMRTDGGPKSISFAWGSSPDPASMTTFATFTDFTNSTFLTLKQLAGGQDPYFNTPNTVGSYYIGIHITSASGTGPVFIDDIVLDANPSPPPKIGIGAPGTDVATFVDNPASKLQFQANYKSPGLITKTYQVATTTKIYGTNGDFLWDVETTTPWITLTKSTPQPTAQGYNFSPPRPRQFQDFTMTLNPGGLAPGVHTGSITLYGILFNDDFPPPASGLPATNEPLVLTVELRIVSTGTKPGSAYEEATLTNLSPGTFTFTGPVTGNPIADVEVTSGVIPSMTIRVYPNQLPPNITRMMYVKRYWQITHTGSAWTANITFPYAEQEAAMVSDRNQLRGVRQAVLRGMWENPIVGTSSTSDPVNNVVTVFDLNETNSGGNIALAQPYFSYTKQNEGAPVSFGLEQNYPNPFNPSTTVSFAVAEERAVRIVVYNSLGMEVGELVNDVLPAGRYSVEFDASALPSGTYLYRMIAGDHVQTMQMVLSK